MDKHRHAAFNTATGEIVTANRGSHLKKCVRRITSWDVHHGYGSGKWVFAHGENWQDKILAKK